MNVTLKNNRGKMAEYAKQALVRYIRDSRLEGGDKLPGQEQLCHALNLSGTTIFRAIQALRDEGVLEVRDKVGTFLKSTDLAGRPGRSIGLAVSRVSHMPSPFYSCLSFFLHRELLEAGCMPVPFTINAQDEAIAVGDFPGLEQAVADERIDGIIDLSGISAPCQLPVPMIYLGSTVTDGAPAAAYKMFIDQADFLRRAMGDAAKLGKRRPALIQSGCTATQSESRLFRRLLDESGFDPAARAYDFGICAITDGRYLAGRIVALPPELRPDVFIFLDEFVGTDFLAGLVVDGVTGRDGYRPTVITGSKRELPMTVPWEDLIVYEISIEELARRTVRWILDLAQRRWQGPDTVMYRMERLPRRPFFQANHQFNERDRV